MIHALDPVFVVEKIACSRIDTIVPIEEVIEQTVTGLKGIGAVSYTHLDVYKRQHQHQEKKPSPILQQTVGVKLKQLKEK